MNMRKIVSFLCCVVVALSSLAYNFVGKTFRGTGYFDGRKMTMTMNFKANNRMSASYTYGGKTESDSKMIWEEAGDYLNLYDSTGDYMYVMIDEDEDTGETVLVMFDSSHNPCFVLRPVASSSGSSRKSSSKKSRR